ncbi:MAG: DUF1697 domain-containing protein [Saprospiraceae bacterium]|nr:DUF1697 domain-containing protein [Saprospiraceae bacterium]
MHTWIALLRGINVGGKHILPMKELRALLEGLGYRRVRTYIQSGNVVFESEARPDTEAISAAIGKKYGFRPTVFILSPGDLRRAAENNPYPTDAGKFVHFQFCDRVPEVFDEQVLASLKAPSESYRLIDQVFYLYAPDGIGRSKLAARVDKAFPGVTLTARNLNTVNKLLEMVE